MRFDPESIGISGLKNAIEMLNRAMQFYEERGGERKVSLHFEAVFYASSESWIGFVREKTAKAYP